MANAIPSEEDVAAGVKAKLEAGAGYGAAFPGGTHYGRRPSGKSFPYLILTVESFDREEVQSDGSFSQRFRVTVTAWVKSGDAAAAATGAARTFLDTNLGGGPNDPTGGLTVANTVGVIWAKRANGRLTLSPELRAGQDALATTAFMDVMVEGKQE